MLNTDKRLWILGEKFQGRNLALSARSDLTHMQINHLSVRYVLMRQEP